MTLRPWSLALVRDAAAWTDRMNDAVVAADGGGLRVTIGAGRTWAIAAVPNVALPDGIRSVRVRVGAVTGGRWLMRLYGDLRGIGRPVTVSLFEGRADAGVAVVPVDPRLLRAAGKPVQVQLGLEGAPPGSAVFRSVEFVAGAPVRRGSARAGQRSIDTVDLMPDIPRPLKVIDWCAKARAFDRIAFDFRAKGEFLPLPWIDDARINADRPTFGIPSYVGDERERGSNQEGVTCLGAVLGATLAGIDKRRQEHDYVLMCEAFYNRRNGANLVLNNQSQGTGGSFWYELFPHLAFYMLADRYPGAGEMDAIVKTTAARWRDAVTAMGGSFDHTAFNFATMKPVDNGQWKEPDAAAGIGWLEYAAWRRFGDPASLQAADTCMRFLSERRDNPYYEDLLPWGTLTAARMNAELDRRYDVDKMLDWCFSISDCRGGWGAIVNRWGDYDCAGLIGSVDNRGGYAFAMNTFSQAAALVPLVRYDTRYAHAIGKWMLNLANAARLFYPGELPPGHETSAFWKGDPGHAIAYEGLRYEWQGKIPCATGDPVALKWGPKTDLGLYGSAYVGFLGGIVRRTDDPAILQLDCLATDFYRGRAYPTYLVHNPYRSARRVRLEVGPRACDLYDAVTDRFLARRVHGRAVVALPAGTAAVVVCTPPGGKLVRRGRQTLVDGVVVDYGTRGAR